MLENEDDWAEFVGQITDHQKDLLFYIHALCGDPDAAADIRQQVNMVLWKKRADFRPGTSFKAWSFRVAQLETKSYLRKFSADKCFSFEPELFERLADEAPEIIGQMPERMQALEECLRGLTPKDDELIRHHYWSEGTLEMLARDTGRSTGTLKARLFQLRSSLRRCIEGKLLPNGS